jgi:hypothetical protein
VPTQVDFLLVYQFFYLFSQHFLNFFFEAFGSGANQIFCNIESIHHIGSFFFFTSPSFASTTFGITTKPQLGISIA